MSELDQSAAGRIIASLTPLGRAAESASMDRSEVHDAVSIGLMFVKAHRDHLLEIGGGVPSNIDRAFELLKSLRFALSSPVNTMPPMPPLLKATALVSADVMAERIRQITAEGYSVEHDDEHDDGSLAKAAACYALHTEPVGNVGDYLRFWPWPGAWKPKNRRHNLVKAGALILAEIERIDRLEARGPICSDCGARLNEAHNYGCMHSQLDV